MALRLPIFDLTHSQQCAVATEPGPERAHPPVTAWSGVGKGSFEDEKERGAAEIPIFLEDRFAPPRLLLSQPEACVQRQKDVAPARMKPPAANVGALDVRAGQDITKHVFCVFCRQGRDLRSQDVAEHARFLFKAKKVAVVGFKKGSPCFPFDAPLAIR